MGNSSRRKGFDFEREIVNDLRSKGFTAERAWGSDGRSMGFDRGVDIVVRHGDGGITGLQCKRSSSISKKFIPGNDQVRGVVIRADRQPPYVVLRWDEYTELLRRTKNDA